MRSLREKVALAAERGIAGVGLWTAHGVLPTTQEGGQIWDVFAAYVNGTTKNTSQQ